MDEKPVTQAHLEVVVRAMFVHYAKLNIELWVLKHAVMASGVTPKQLEMSKAFIEAQASVIKMRQTAESYTLKSAAQQSVEEVLKNFDGTVQ